jgi:hypothetical protein
MVRPLRVEPEEERSDASPEERHQTIQQQLRPNR